MIARPLSQQYKNAEEEFEKRLQSINRDLIERWLKKKFPEREIFFIDDYYEDYDLYD